MSTPDDIRAAIVAKLSAVPAIGVVHDYERYAKSEAEFRRLYVSEIGGQQLLRGWYARRIAAREAMGIVGVVMCVNDWRIVGYHGLDDATASEKTFDTLIESVCTAFRTDPTLGDVVGDLRDLISGGDDSPYGMQIEDSAPVLLAGTLCHRAQLRLTTSHAIRF